MSRPQSAAGETAQWRLSQSIRKTTFVSVMSIPRLSQSIRKTTSRRMQRSPLRRAWREWLERAFEQRSYYLATYFPTDERLDNLHTDPRFTDLKRRLGLPDAR